MFENSTSSSVLSADESTHSISPIPTQRLDSVLHVVDVFATQPSSSTNEKPSLVSGGKSVLAFTITIIAAICLNAAPWLMEQGLPGVLCGWLGVMLALVLSAGGGLASRFVVTWIWCSCSVGLAFHWSPAAMAYTLSSGLTLGAIVAFPLILWDGLRLALGYWIAARITKDVRFQWLVTAITAIVLEYIMPGVFPWKIGCILLPLPWTIQAVDIFGPSYSTFVVFAIVGVIQVVVEAMQRYSLQPRIGGTSDTKVTLAATSRWKAVFLSPAFVAQVRRSTTRCHWPAAGATMSAGNSAAESVEKIGRASCRERVCYAV